MNRKDIKKLFAGIIAILTIIPVFVLGATIEIGEEVNMVRGEGVSDNLYVAGGNVSIDDSIQGDLIGAGGNVLISGNVSDDVLIAGGSITVLGNTDGDVRVLGGNILINGNVSGELVIVGGTVIISSDSSIGKDVVVAGGQVTINGEVGGNLKIAGGVVLLNGHIAGNVDAKIDERLTLGNSAVVDGGLNYSARNSDVLKMSEEAVISGETVFKSIKYSRHNDKKNFAFAVITGFITIKLISLIITALVLIWLFKNFSNSVVTILEKSPIKMLGKGFIALIIIPVSGIILFITIVGIPLGIMTMFSYGLLLFFSCIYSGVVIGAWVSKILYKSELTVITWKNVIAGFFLLTIMHLIPIVGWTVALLIFLATLGTIVDIIQNKINNR